MSTTDTRPLHLLPEIYRKYPCGVGNPRVNPDGRCEVCGEKACPSCGKESCDCPQFGFALRVRTR